MVNKRHARIFDYFLYPLSIGLLRGYLTVFGNREEQIFFSFFSFDCFFSFNENFFSFFLENTTGPRVKPSSLVTVSTSKQSKSSSFSETFTHFRDFVRGLSYVLSTTNSRDSSSGTEVTAMEITN